MSEIGIIGQMYEDRRTKKVGKLVERDEKYKTLLFESEDGKSFNVSFGGFKSNWRKYESVEATEESIKLEEPVVESTEPVKEDVKPAVHKKPRKGQLHKEYTDAVLAVSKLVSSIENERLTLHVMENKTAFVIKIDNKRLFEVYTRPQKGYHFILVSESVYRELEPIKDNIGIAYVRNSKTAARSIKLEVPVDFKFSHFCDGIKNCILNNLVKESEE